jgi:hypothetical protein
MDQIYFYKYKKYKNKYINLKLNQFPVYYGGGNNKIQNKIDRSSTTSYFNGRLIYNNKTKQTIYYADFKKKYKFFTGEEGFNFLKHAYFKLQKLLDHNMILIKKKHKNRTNEIISIGKRIYIDKTSLKKKKSGYGSGEFVTWTDEEYNHLGLQRYYLIVKTYQRFTEIWSLLERSHYSGVFKNTPEKLVVCSIGGGPGIEGYTLKMFLKKYYPKKKLKFITLDLAETWKEYIPIWDKDFLFYKYDMYQDDLFKKIDVSSIDFIIISNVLVMYMTNEKSYQLIKSLLDNGVKNILINSRAAKVEAKKELIKKGLKITNLINEKDDRQFVVSNNQYKLKDYKPLFPNVPFIN